MPHLTIDGKFVEVPPETTVLQAARMAGIEIPTLCDHPAVIPYGGCRLCVVEVQGARGMQASCTLPASEGMIVSTDTPKLREARKFVLTMLFSERNHFCMYCQKTNGDCELQNSAYNEDMTHWPIQPNWKPFEVDASHPHYIVDHNRCILCRRCVRACSDLVGSHTLSMENRGAHTVLVADYGVPFGESSCVHCGTCVQICPTGALIDRQSAYKGLEYEMTRTASVCVGCSVGCGIETLTRNNKLVRIEGNWNAPVNGGVLCELGRYDSLMKDVQRLETPLVRRDGALVPASWEEALQTVAERLSNSGQGLAALASTRLPAEALYAFKQIFADGLHSDMVAGIEEDLTTAQQSAGSVDGDLEALKTADCVVAIGVDLVNSHQVAGFFVRRNPDCRLVVIDPGENDMDDLANWVIRPTAGSDLAVLQALKALVETQSTGAALAVDLDAVSVATSVPGETLLGVSSLLLNAKQPVFVYGKGLSQNASAETIQALRDLAASLGQAAVVNVKGKANSLAAHCYGLDHSFEVGQRSNVFLALGDDMPTRRLENYVENAQFVVVQTALASPLVDKADVVFPVEMWAEQQGHYLNLEGRLQQAVRSVQPAEGIRSNLEVLENLAGRLGITLSDAWKAALDQALPQAELA